MNAPVSTIGGKRGLMTGPRVMVIKEGGRTAYEVNGLPTMSPNFRTRAEADLWMREQVAKLPASCQPRERACLCCGHRFMSEGAHNRLCTSCRHRSDDGFIPTGIARPARRRGGARNG